MSKLFPGSSKRTRLMVLIALVLLGTGLSVAGYAVLAGRERSVIEYQFQADAERRVSETGTRFRNDVIAVYSLSQFLNDPPGIFTEFRTVVSSRMPEDRDVQAAFWIPRVTGPQRDAHEAKSAAEGLDGYGLTERNEFGVLVRRAAVKDDAFPVQYAEPLESHRSWLGFDVSTDPVLKRPSIRRPKPDS